MTTPNQRYTLLAILLHWVIAIGIFTMLGLGWYMSDLPDGAEKTATFALHKSIGLTVFLLVLLRLVWRFTHRPPELPVTIPARQRVLSMINHQLLYFLMFAQPVSGYLSASFSGYKTKYWGIPLPHWGWKDEFLNELLSEIHEFSSVLLTMLVVMHIGGALLHLFTPGDRLFRRMLPWG